MKTSPYLLDDRFVAVHAHDGDERKDALAVRDEHGCLEHISTEEAAAQVTASLPVEDRTEELSRALGLSRRRVIQGAAASTLTALMATSPEARMAFAAPAPAAAPRHTLVVVFLRGGLDGLSLVAPVGDPAYARLRPTLAVGSGSHRLTSMFALHPAAQGLKRVWDQGHLAIAQGVGLPQQSRSHFANQAVLERGTPASVQSGWLGRHLATSGTPGGLFRALSMGPKVIASLYGSEPVLSMATLPTFTIDNLPGAGDLLGALDRAWAGAGGMLAEQAQETFSALRDVKSVRQTPMIARAQYPAGRFGGQLADLARVIKSRKGLEAAALDLGGWDMHARVGSPTDAQGWMHRQVKELSDGLTAFHDDLGADIANVTVLVMSEFGRRVAQNAGGGFDHGYGNVMLALGGRVTPRFMSASFPGLGSTQLYRGDVDITLDYRDLVSEVLTRHLGSTHLAEIFPDHTPKPVGWVR